MTGRAAESRSLLRKSAVLAATLLTLTACGSGGYENATELREAAQEAGVPCPDIEERDPGLAAESLVACVMDGGLSQTTFAVYSEDEQKQTDIDTVRSQRNAGTLIGIPCLITGDDWSVAFLELTTLEKPPIDCEKFADELGGEVTV